MGSSLSSMRYKNRIPIKAEMKTSPRNGEKNSQKEAMRYEFQQQMTK